MRFKWRRQGKKPNCGAVAAAVLLDVPVKLTDELADLCGANRGTTPKQLQKVFRLFGAKLHRKRPMPKRIPKLAVAMVGNPKWQRGNSLHWVAVADNKIYDGSRRGKWPKTWRFLEVYLLK